MIKLLPQTSMCKPLFSRNFYSNFCLWEVFFASFYGLLKITFVPHSSLFSHQNCPCVDEPDSFIIVPHKSHNFGVSLAYHLRVQKHWPVPSASFTHSFTYILVVSSPETTTHHLGFFISSCLIFTTQLLLFSAQVVLKRKLSPNYAFDKI